MLVLARVELIFFTVAIMWLFWICAEHGTNIEIFCYNTEIFVIAEQVLHRAKAGRRLEGDTTGTGDPNCPKGNSRPYDIVGST